LDEKDLSLIPLDDLIDEIERRRETFVIAFETNKKHRKLMMFRYGKGLWMDAVRLSSVLNNDVLNNRNNELRKLQRIVEEYGG